MLLFSLTIIIKIVFTNVFLQMYTLYNVHKSLLQMFIYKCFYKCLLQVFVKNDFLTNVYYNCLLL